MSISTGTTRRRSLEIFPAENGWIVRDTRAYRADPLNDTPGVGAHVYPTAAELAQVLPRLLGETGDFISDCKCPICSPNRSQATVNAA